MRIYIDPARAPLKGVSPNMMERRSNEMIASLAERGIVAVGFGPTHIEVNLRELAEKNGTARRGQAALVAALDELGCDRVDVEPGDVAYVRGSQDVISHAISRGMESNIAGLTTALTNITPDELFEGLDKAEAFIYNDKAPVPELNDYLRAGAESDLRANGLISRDTTDPYQFLEPTVEPEPEPGPWETTPMPYKSPWDLDEI